MKHSELTHRGLNRYWPVVIVLAACAVAGAEPLTRGAATSTVTSAAMTSVSMTSAAARAAANGRVTLNADDTPITQILNAFSRQTGRSVVVGPEVTGRTTVRLEEVPWEEALDAILKPFGYGHYTEGNATVVCGVDTLVPRIFELKYLDVADIEDVIKTFLSARGKVSKIVVRGQSWGAAAEGGGSSVAGGPTMGKRQRGQENKDLAKTKTLLVTDVPAVLDQITLFLNKVDVAPSQILIEARFLEVNPRVLQDMGVEFGTGANGAQAAGVQSVGLSQGGSAYGVGLQQVSGGVAPVNFSAASAPSLNANPPFNAGLGFAFQRLSDVQFQVLLHMLQEDASINVLSAPRILTLNNQEATIIVATKYPIINSDASGGNGVTATITTSLRGYEDIGIQLNVLPQICDGRFISMIVRPSVRELVGTKAGRTVSGETTALTEYPVISTREAETQILARDGQTIVIGGLLKDKESKTLIKVPVLGDVPLLGALFRRETIQNEKIDLLIFLTASIVPAGGSDLVYTNFVAQAPPVSIEPVVTAPVPTPKPSSVAAKPTPVPAAAKPAPVVTNAAPVVVSVVVTPAPVAPTPKAPAVTRPAPVAPVAPPAVTTAVTTAVAPASVAQMSKGPAVTRPALPEISPAPAPAAPSPDLAMGDDEALSQAIARARAASEEARKTADAIRKTGTAVPQATTSATNAAGNTATNAP